jgi:tetratricopeptide (TPR) repeat protein
MSTIKDVVVAGIEAHKRKDFDTALRIYDQVLGLKIYDPYLCHALGTLFLDMDLLGVSIQFLTRSVETSPEDAPWLAESYVNLGVALRNSAHEMEAAACYRRSLELDATNTATWANYAGCYINYGQPEKAVQFAERALEIDPNNVHARHHKALALMELGKYDAGFRAYEARLNLPEFHKRNYDGKRWLGGKVSGTLVIHGEQGLGDEVMFCSLIPQVKKLCDRLVIECNEKLVPLFERSFGVKCYGDSEDIKKNEKVDHWCPMGSLPYIFRVRNPQEHQGYLKTDPALDEKYKKTEKFRVGVTWRGGSKKTHDHLRNFSLKRWKEFVRPEWVSLQYGKVKQEVEFLGLQDPGWGGDMDEFASLVKSCDLVITVCNTTVHFAGALNVPCWVMVPSKPAWRYGLTGKRMLFYPSVTMYRQADGEDWSEVMKRITNDYNALTEQRLAA